MDVACAVCLSLIHNALSYAICTRKKEKIMIYAIIQYVLPLAMNSSLFLTNVFSLPVNYTNFYIPVSGKGA